MGSTPAAEAMAQRLREGGFAAEDIQVVGPGGRKQNLVVRLKGTGRKRPVLLIGHLDVVEALREDWTVDPFVFLEKDGYFYGRGTQDMKDGIAIMMTTLLRYRAEGYQTRPRHHPGADGGRGGRQLPMASTGCCRTGAISSTPSSC